MRNLEKTELLKKLKALSDRGVSGEKENATKLLKKLMKKYGISEEEIQKDEVKQIYINLRTDIEVRLASQILYAFFDNAPLYKCYKSKIKHYTKLTASQAIEFKYMFSIYLEDFYKQELVFYRAFLNKNGIFPKNLKAKSLDEIPPEERKDIILSQMMAQGIERTKIRKALDAGKD